MVPLTNGTSGAKIVDIKQGQTIYEACFDWSCLKPSIRAIFLYSKNKELPDSNLIIDEMPVTYMRKVLAKHGSKGYYHSRRKAEREYKRIREQYKGEYSGY